MSGLFSFFENIRKRSLEKGFACDGCGAELFDYPTRRLCEACEGQLLKLYSPCPLCGREGLSTGVCLTCKVKPPKFKGVSAFVYRSEAALMINRAKNGNPRLCAYFGERLADRFLEVCGAEIEGERLLVIPVPLTEEKRRERGYNQAERIAEKLVERLRERGVEVEMDLTFLVKKRETKAQKQMTSAERAENVKGAYHLTERTVFKGRTVLLVDDIMTTGATGNECARKLLSAGANGVYFLTATATPER